MSFRRILGYRWQDYMFNDLVLSEVWAATSHLHSSERQLRLYGHLTRLPAEDPAHRIFPVEIQGLDHAEGASRRSVVASGGVLSEGYGHDGHGVRQSDGQTEAYLEDMNMAGLAFLRSLS